MWFGVLAYASSPFWWKPSVTTILVNRFPRLNNESSMMLSLYAVLVVLVEFSWSQKDPLNDFCRRFGHQTAVVDQKLFIDGGLIDWNPIAQNDQNYTSELRFLSYLQLQTTYPFPLPNPD
jgi:hypothetical protein